MGIEAILRVATFLLLSEVVISLVIKDLSEINFYKKSFTIGDFSVTTFNSSGPLDGEDDLTLNTGSNPELLITENLQNPSPPPVNNLTLAREGYYNLLSGVVDYPLATNTSVIPNPLNASVANLQDFKRSRVRSEVLESRTILADGSIQIQVEGGMWMRVHLGYAIEKAVFEAVTDLLFDQVTKFVTSHNQMTHNLDFYCENLVTHTKWNYFAYLPPASIKQVSTTVLHLAFRAMYAVCNMDPDTELQYARPFLARAWELYAPDGKTPVLMGFFRQKF